ncbi:MAG: FeoB-associated Cys-rich membrane protein [Planctomycetes bacterium]|nr:FeoB-associated Cys-rich membrane protein [Planctomycetota bacterium]
MIETIIVIVIVAVVTALVIRRMYKTLSGKNSGCCGNKCKTTNCDSGDDGVKNC